MRIEHVKVFTRRPQPEQTGGEIFPESSHGAPFPAGQGKYHFVPGGVLLRGDRIEAVYTEDGSSKDVLLRDAAARAAVPGTNAPDTSADAAQGEVIDGRGAFLIPGMIDLHFHGCMGDDICDGTLEAIERIAAYEASIGVTTICPATMTLPLEELEAVLRTAAQYQRERKAGIRDGAKHADFAGLNMEGPFISPVKKGAQDGVNILPASAAVAGRLLDASEGLVKFLGLAPEESPDYLAYIKTMKERVKISLAHTNADYGTAKAAFDAGACHVVHLYNAMPPFHHRDPGVVGAAADSPQVSAELICDGIHVHPAVVRSTIKMLGEERVVFISDSMRATGMPDGRYLLGGLEVCVRGNRAVLAEGGSLAGSVMSLPDIVRTAVREMGIPLETAVACASVNPARCLGIEDTVGSVEPGKKANLVLLGENLELLGVIKDGKVLK